MMKQTKKYLFGNNNTTMKVVKIQMPQGCRYMSDYRELTDELPLNGKFILNKRLPGCGGTSLFLGYPKPLVLVSPRRNILVSKSEQYKNSYLFRDPSKKKVDINTLKNNLKNYLKNRIINPFSPVPDCPKILVTVDSFKYVAEVLVELGRIDDFLFLVDEFQNLMADAAFKGKTDMEFLSLIDSTCKNIIYMSATPIDSVYLDVVEQFKDLPYYTLEWDPAILEVPNIKEVQIKPPYTVNKICAEIIQKYRNTGYFAEKRIGGLVYYSTEVCVFLNDVNTIRDIILENNLDPSEVTVMVSESNRNVTELEQSGFKIGGLCTDRNNPKNKTFTFCSKASFEGTDFYSTNAITVVFIDGTVESRTLDIAIDLPQIMGRQRLDINPFRRDVTLYYRARKNPKSRQEMEAEQEYMLESSEKLLQSLNTQDEPTRNLLAGKLRAIPEHERYKSDYIDVFDTLNGFEFRINWLAMIAKTDIWHRQSHFYNNSFCLLSGVSSAMSQTFAQKPKCLVDFERSMYATSSFQAALRLYVEFLEMHPDLYGAVLCNPYIPQVFDDYCSVVPVEYMKSVYYREKPVVARYKLLTMKAEISGFCSATFAQGNFYSKPDAKRLLQGIYDQLQIEETAKASDLLKYIQAKKRWITIGDNRVAGYIIC